MQENNKVYEIVPSVFSRYATDVTTLAELLTKDLKVLIDVKVETVGDKPKIMVSFLKGKEIYEKVAVNEAISSGADQNLAVSKYLKKVLDTEVYGY